MSAQPCYDRGFVIQLAAEAAAVKVDAGDILDLWRAAFAAVGDEGLFASAQFLDVATRRRRLAFAELAGQSLASCPGALSGLDRQHTLGTTALHLRTDAIAHIAEREHGAVTSISWGRKTDIALTEGGRIAEAAEQNVPKRLVAVVNAWISRWWCTKCAFGRWIK